MTIQAELKKSTHNYFRRCYIRRRPNTTTGAYEADWQEVTDLVKQWGTVSWSIDDTKLNKFEQSSVNMVFRNDERQWNDVNDSRSLFFGFTTRYKTQIRINCGIVDDDGIDQPTSNALFYGFITDNIVLNSDDEAIITVNSLHWVLEEQNAGAITALTSVTASDIVDEVRDLQDGSGNDLFQNFITAGAWNIQTTSVVYTDVTSQGLSNYSCWGLLNKLAESENFIVFFDNSGNVNFKDRDPNTTVAMYGFNGAGAQSDQYGINVISMEEETTEWTRIFQRVRCKFESPNTSTSFYTKEETFTVADNSSSWLYGQRPYDFENLWLTSVGAQTLVDAIQADYVTSKRQFVLTTKLITFLGIGDPVYVNWLGEVSTLNPSYWGSAIWGVDVWTGRKGGISINSVSCTIIRADMDLDSYTSRFKLREQ